MRWLLLVLLMAACGGADICSEHDATYNFTASQTQLLGAGCTDLPASFAVSATWKGQPDGSYLLSGTENGTAFMAPPSRALSSNCVASPVWYDATSWHMYALPFADGVAELHIGRTGQCMAIYSLR